MTVVISGKGLPCYDPKEHLQELVQNVVKKITGIEITCGDIAHLHRSKTEKEIYLE